MVCLPKKTTKSRPRPRLKFQMSTLKIVYFVCIWLAMAFLEFGWQLLGINPFPDTISIPFADIHNYSYPKLATEMIPDWLIWTILICTGPVIHIFLLGFARSYRLSTAQFVMAYGTVPPIVCFIVTSLKFTVAEPRPNFLHRCFDGPESSVQVTIKGHELMNYSSSHYPNADIIVSSCPNENRNQVVGGLMSFPSGHAAHSFGIFTFLFFLVADVTPELFRPMVFALIYTFPAVCAGSRIRDHQHHLHDVVIGSILGTIIGYYVHKNGTKEEVAKIKSSTLNDW